MKIIVAVTGASGAIYGRQLVEELLTFTAEVIEEIALIFSNNGSAVAAHEGQTFPQPLPPSPLSSPCHNNPVEAHFKPAAEPISTHCIYDARLKVYSNSDLFTPPASGSARYDAMIIAPCSMGTLARIAAGISSDLITRAADVTLKEHRPLILLPRESPLSTIHLQNMLTLVRAGALILPAAPPFYHLPATIEDLTLPLIHRVLTLLNLTPRKPTYQWQSNSL